MDWKKKEWRIPRRGDIVRCPENQIGRVVRTTGTLEKRNAWVEDIHGNEIYADMPGELFFGVENEECKKFNLERLAIRGIVEGAICVVNDDHSLPLEIVHLEWSNLQSAVHIWVKNFKSFKGEIFKVYGESTLEVFNLNLPNRESMFSPVDSNLNWRIEINLIERNRNGWAPTGDPWAFSSQEESQKEIEIWKSRMIIKRIASIINSGKKPSSIFYAVDSISIEDKIYLKISPYSHPCGHPAYFPTASHAALCTKYVSPEEWIKSSEFTQDSFSLEL